MDKPENLNHYSKRTAARNANITYCRTVYASTIDPIGDKP